MDGATEITLDDGRTVELKEMGNGCYVELYDDGERINSQYLLGRKAVFRHFQHLPISSGLKVRLAEVIEEAIDWLDEGEGSEKNWKESASRSDKLIHYAIRNYETGIMQDVAEELAREGVMLSNRSGELFPLGEWGRPTGSYVATVSGAEAGKCPDCGADKSETWECVRSSNRTTKANVYKCQDCGKRQKGITTG